MSERLRVLAVGEALVDIVKPADSEATEHVGGSPANVAVGVAALGHPTMLATFIGRDERGEMIANYLAEREVGLVEGSQDAPRTSTATAKLDDEGGATYDFDLEWQVPSIDLASFAHVHTGSIAATLQPGASDVFTVMSEAREHATVSYDPNARPTIMGSAHDARNTIEERIGRCDVVKASAEDIEWLYEGAEASQVARLWGRLGPPLVIITDGRSGALVYHTPTDSQTWVDAPSINVVDTVGAGDSFMGGLISGLLDAGLLGSPAARERLTEASSEALTAAVQRGIASAAYTVARAGAASPTREDLDIPVTAEAGDDG
ncbi:MAG TPA: carbohydrate kinase [Ornithinimicrobium sp.]|uniref:carbohydrate kinase family protein n=1 Tax=Ornithinimicrobium sp. TaxID=1977084 RepID=UPI002B470E70|nr:carbohydrate kinase [Ornithinimicrobium sp.]HKJ11097.1 carbohydrate kinase [Ornithinimicrobium sp.]